MSYIRGRIYICGTCCQLMCFDCSLNNDDTWVIDYDKMEGWNKNKEEIQMKIVDKYALSHLIKHYQKEKDPDIQQYIQGHITHLYKKIHHPFRYWVERKLLFKPYWDLDNYLDGDKNYPLDWRMNDVKEE